jgi:hypothetical protein
MLGGTIRIYIGLGWDPISSESLVCPISNKMFLFNRSVQPYETAGVTAVILVQGKLTAVVILKYVVTHTYTHSLLYHIQWDQGDKVTPFN